MTIDTSRVALALARQRLMSARYPAYLLADFEEGRRKEAAVTGRAPLTTPVHGDLCQGFVYERVPHVTLKSIANNAEIDVIWEEAEEELAPLLADLNRALGTAWREWEVPRALDAEETAKTLKKGEANPMDGVTVTSEAQALHAAWWERRVARQKAIDDSIARAADVEMLYDRPYEDKSKVRVAGPFTVESLSPHRVVPMDDADDVLDEGATGEERKKLAKRISNEAEFANAVLENLKASGVQTGDRRDRIVFNAIEPFASNGMIHAKGTFTEDGATRTAAICIGPEYGTLHRTDLTAAAREAAELRMDALVACAFAYDAHATELKKLGPLPILKAKMNPDLHMAEELRTDKNANLFMVIGEPDVELIEEGDDLRVRVLGLDLVKPQEGGKPIARGTDEIAAWFVDTDYDEETFFVRQAYFLGAGDPYKSLRTALKAEVDKEAWETLYSDTSRPFPRPASGRIAVKVIDHYGDEVMRVMGV